MILVFYQGITRACPIRASDLFSGIYYSLSAWMANDTTDDIITLTQYTCTNNRTSSVVHLSPTLLKLVLLCDCVAVKTPCWPGIEIPPGLFLLSTSCSASFHLCSPHLLLSQCVLAIIPSFYPTLCMAALVCMAV